MSNEILVKEESSVRLSVQEVCEQVNAIQQVLNLVMKKGTHYGVVPGCGDKPTLLKPGAEKLALTFRLDLQTETEVIEMAGGHREYRSKTKAYSHSGESRGSGMGSCSTMETKFRYRNENTGRSVPDQYWKTRDSNLLGGPSYTTRKVDGKWFIFQQVEYPNPADYYNTCLKMSEKRSKVAAVLNVTAASDIFTQDIEDMQEVLNQETGEILTPQKPSVSAPKEVNSSLNPKNTEAETVMCSQAVGNVITGVKAITQKPTKTGILRYKITGESADYFTFDSKFAELAKTAQGAALKVSILYKEGKYGNNITGMDIVEPEFNSEINIEEVDNDKTIQV